MKSSSDSDEVTLRRSDGTFGSVRLVYIGGDKFYFNFHLPCSLHQVGALLVVHADDLDVDVVFSEEVDRSL